MKYRYPKISSALTYHRVDDNSFEVVDHLTDNSFTFGINIVRYVRKLDGFTHPYKIPSALSKEEIDDTIKFLDEYDLIRHSDTMRVSFGTTLKTLWIPRRTLFLRLFAYVSNALLILSWLPILIIGIAMFVNNIEAIEFDWLWAGYFFALLVVIHFIILRIVPAFKGRENLWMFIFVAISSIPLNIYILTLVNEWELLFGSIFVLGILRCILYYAILFSIEEIIMGVITRLIWRRQYKLVL